MREAVVVDVVRPPCGRAGQRGAFRDITHVELVTSLLKEALERNKLPAEEVDEVLWGSVGIAGMLTRSRDHVRHVRRCPRRRRRDDGPRAADRAGRRAQPGPDPDRRGDGTRDAPHLLAGGEEAGVDPALVPGDGALDHGHGTDGGEAGPGAWNLTRGRRPVRPGEPPQGRPRPRRGALLR